MRLFLAGRTPSSDFSAEKAVTISLIQVNGGRGVAAADQRLGPDNLIL